MALTVRNYIADNKQNIPKALFLLIVNIDPEMNCTWSFHIHCSLKLWLCMFFVTVVVVVNVVINYSYLLNTLYSELQDKPVEISKCTYISDYAALFQIVWSEKILWTLEYRQDQDKLERIKMSYKSIVCQSYLFILSPVWWNLLELRKNYKYGRLNVWQPYLWNSGLFYTFIWDDLPILLWEKQPDSWFHLVFRTSSANLNVCLQLRRCRAFLKCLICQNHWLTLTLLRRQNIQTCQNIYSSDVDNPGI